VLLSRIVKGILGEAKPFVENNDRKTIELEFEFAPIIYFCLKEK
jgi:hypothetical protein